MYCYVLTYWCYEDSMLLPIFHEDKYSIEEFEGICQKANEKAKMTNPYTDNKESTIYDVYHILIDEYGFESLDDKVLSFNLNDSKANPLKEDTELKILLNMAPI